MKIHRPTAIAAVLSIVPLIASSAASADTFSVLKPKAVQTLGIGSSDITDACLTTCSVSDDDDGTFWICGEVESYSNVNALAINRAECNAAVDLREDRSDDIVGVLNDEVASGKPKEHVTRSALAASAAILFTIDGAVKNANSTPRLRDWHPGCNRKDRRWNQDCLHAGKFACKDLTGAAGGLIAGSRLYCFAGKEITGPRPGFERGSINEIMKFCRDRGYALAAGASYTRSDLTATCVPGLHFQSRRVCEDVTGGLKCSTQVHELTFGTQLNPPMSNADFARICKTRFGDRVVPAGGPGYGCALPVARFDIRF